MSLPRSIFRCVIAVFAFLVLSTSATYAAGTNTTVLRNEHQDYDLTAAPSAVFADPTGELDIDEVARAGHFRDLSRIDPSVFRQATFWIRFSVLRPPGNEAGWFLQTSAFCTTADLYEPDARGGYDHHGFGWSVPYARHPFPGAFPAIALDRPALSGRIEYVRLACPISQLAATITSDHTLSASWTRDATLHAYEDCTMIVFAVLGIVFACMTRERIYLLSAGPPLLITILDLSGQANISRIFPSLSMPPFVATYVIIVVVFFVAQWLFIRAFLDLRARMPALDRAFAIALAIICCVMISRLFPLPADAGLLAVGELLFYGIPMASALVAWKRGSRRARFFVAGLAAVIVGFVGLNLNAIGINILPAPLLWIVNQWALQFESLMLFTGIADRFRRTLLDNQAALAESDAAKTALVDAQRRHISETEHRSESFARFVPKDFLEHLSRSEITDVELGDHAERAMSVLFTDIRGFTTLVETLSPAETFAFLNAYLKRAGPAIRQNAGFIDKYVGDAIMALFPRTPLDAIEAALTLQREVRQFNDIRARLGDLPIAIGIGINFGTLMLGTIGEVQRLETTVLSDAVNIASRIEGLTKRYSAGIIAGEAFVKALPENHPYHLRPLGTVQLKGLTRSVGAFEIFDGDPSELLLHKMRTLDRFTAALAVYQQGKFDESRRLFDEIARANHGDGAAAFLRDRSAIFSETINLAWDGVDRLESK